MHSGLDIFRTLHALVEEAVAILPGGRRGSLLAREDRRLVYRAAIGLDVAPSGRLRIPSGAGELCAAPPFGPEAAPDAARGPAIVPAEAWYRAHLPSAAGLDGSPKDAWVVVLPLSAHGEPIAYLALEQHSDALPDAERQTRLAVLAESGCAALERFRLFNEKAQVAQELRLLEDVLNAVATSVEIHKLIEVVGGGIRSVQPQAQWTAIHLAMPEDHGRATRAPEHGRVMRLYTAPRPMTSYWRNLREGTLAAGRDLGIDVEFKVGTSEGANSQQAIIEDGLRRGVDAVALAPVDGAAIEPWIARAMDAGIPVIAYDSPPLPDSRALLYVGTDNVAAGRLAGELMTRLVPKKGTVAVQTPSALMLNSRQRVAGFVDVASGAGLTLLPPDESAFDADRGMQRALAMLRGRPDIAGAFGVCSENGPCLGAASSALGRSGDLKIIAFDPVPSSIAMLREGVVHAVIAQREYDMGYRSVDILHAMVLRGVPATLAELPGSRILDTGVDVVTLERTPWSSALSDYLATCSARRVSIRKRGAGDRALKFLVVGMAESKEHVVEEHVATMERSLIGHVMGTARSLVVDTLASEHAAWPDVDAARQHGARTLVGVPLLAGDDVLGVLTLSSARADACSPEDLAQIERITGAAAIALHNARLLSRLMDRTSELERLSQHQEGLLSTIAELSSPVVPIAKGVLVMPVIGVMDEQRSDRFIDAMLQEISDHAARVVIIDVTGMAVVDARAADHLVKAARAASLLGAEVVLVGVSPTAARLMVEQSFDLGTVATRSTLELGFAYALRRTKGRIVHAP